MERSGGPDRVPASLTWAMEAGVIAAGSLQEVLGVDGYFGIVIEQSLRNRDVLDPDQIVARKRVGSWRFLLVSVPGAQIDQHIQELQPSMVTDDNWYAHYFRAEELIVVFRDAIFRVSIDSETWGPVVEHGLRSGIPLEQLDFKPRTVADSESFFSPKEPLRP